MGKGHPKKKRHGITMDERQANRLEGRMKMMGEAKRKLTRAMSAQTEMIEQGIVGAHLTDKPKEQALPKETTKRTGKGSPYPDPLVVVAQLVDVFQNFTAVYDKAEADVSRMDMELGDLQHAVELCTLPKRESLKLVQEIKKNRTERRKAKDFTQKARPLYDWLKGKPMLTGSLIELQKELVKIDEAMGRRTYTPRVREDLKGLFEGAAESAPTKERKT